MSFPRPAPGRCLRLAPPPGQPERRLPADGCGQAGPWRSRSGETPAVPGESGVPSGGLHLVRSPSMRRMVAALMLTAVVAVAGCSDDLDPIAGSWDADGPQPTGFPDFGDRATIVV